MSLQYIEPNPVAAISTHVETPASQGSTSRGEGAAVLVGVEDAQAGIEPDRRSGQRHTWPT